MDRYILVDKKAVPCPDLYEWARWIDKRSNKVVANDVVNRFRISTVFLGIDHGFDDGATPVLFETMIFPEDSWEDLFCQRYTTYHEAEATHKRVVELVKVGVNPADLGEL